MKRTARYYKYGSTVPGESNPSAAARAKRKKKATDKEVHSNPEVSRRKVESARARRAAKRRGVDLEGKDMAHTSNGIRPKSASANRGSTSDSPGDKRARAKGRKKKS
jgi:pyruvate/2-oxoglutarate dehydrogenase complex dihydrolipoamide acyltransferase (E2) component